MDIFLRRILFRKDGILGEIQADNGGFSCATLEHAFPLSTGFGQFIAKVPNGIYMCKRGMHRLKGMVVNFETFEVTNVPGATGILFHPGNWNGDSEGCILLGEHTTSPPGPKPLMILSSRATFQRFMTAQTGVNQFALTVQTESDQGPMRLM